MQLQGNGAEHGEAHLRLLMESGNGTEIRATLQALSAVILSGQVDVGLSLCSKSSTQSIWGGSGAR